MAEAGAPADDIEAVAIVGMALRVPGALGVDRFWENLRDGVESTRYFDDEQLRASGVPEAALRDPAYVKAFGALEGADLFDAGFFDMPPREAEILDPQHRQLLECSWEALEHAGYAPGCAGIAAAGRIGVLAGVGLNGYLLHNLIGRSDLIETLGGWQINLGNDKDFAATRVAYKLDLRGAAVNVSTACSTSLVAVAMGCQSLLSYQCDTILAGGCSIHLPQDQGYWHHPGGTLSPDGRCRAFDAQAQGTLDGNGVAMLVLKRLADAQRDGDTIHALIRGYAINNDGALKVGYTAPGVEGQAAVIREAQEMAGIGADSIGYVETHGTGTDLGDLVEITALTEAFRSAGSTAIGQCALGSVKTNVGHLDTAAGATSLIKTVLGLRHGLIPPSLHFTRANPKLGLETSPFYVNAALRPWPHLAGAPRRAGVSSFGIGGTNAHLVVEQAPAVAPSDPGRPWQLLPLSARSQAALQQNAGRLAAHLRDESEAPLADIAYTLQLGRRAFSHRRVVLAAGREDAIVALADGSAEGGTADRSPVLVFLFPGQDAQYPGMAQGLYRDEPLFRAEVGRCAEIVRSTHGIDLLARLFPPEGEAGPAFAIDPLPLFVVEYALARLWLALGLRPRAMLGYSLGEYACACLAGVLSLEDALSLAVAGGRLLSLLAPGPLLAVSLPEAELRPLLGPGLGLAMVSAPRQCVVGGRPDAVAALARTLAAMGAAHVAIPLGLPFHTEFMEPFLAPYRAELQRVRFRAPRIPYVSCVTGDWIRPEEATDPEHYLRLASQTVLLARGLERLFALPETLHLEVGPGQVMSSFVMLQAGRPATTEVLSSLRDPRYAGAPAGDLPAWLATVGRLWRAGVDIDWSAFYGKERRQRLPLPSYAFEHQRYWVDSIAPPPAPAAAEDAAAGKRADPEKWFYLPGWRALLPLARPRLAGRWLVAGAAAGLAPSLAERLRQAGAEVVLDDRGDWANAAHWDALFDDGPMFDHIVYLGLSDCDGDDDDDDDELLEAGFHALLALGRSLGRRLFSGALTLTLIAAGVLPFNDAALSPAKAAALGPLRVLPQEYPNLVCRAIDVGDPAPDRHRTHGLDHLTAELAGSERAVCLRSGRRWVEDFAPYPLPDPAKGSPEPGLFRAGGVYLITGGLGNIGLTLAALIAQGAPGACLVLTTRQPLAAQSDARRQQLRSLEALGAKVRVAQADVADPAAMAALVAEIEQRFGPINGVVHAAGVVGKASFATVGESTRAMAAAQLDPKLRGARVLEAVLGERPLDFCVLCSSLSPILGGLGFAAYAAANACLDACAIAHNRRHPVRWLSVNWEGWRFEEDTGGHQAGAAVAELGLLPGEGADALLRILAASPPDRIVLSTGDLQERIRQWVDRVDLAAQEAVSTARSRHARPAMLGAHVAPSGAIALEVARLWESLLGIDGIGAQDSFFELGGNSLLLTQLLAHIRKSFRLELSLAALFERPTIADTAALIAAVRAEAAEREEGVL